MNYTAEEKEKIANIMVQINNYLDEERKQLRKTVRIKIPNRDGYDIEIVIPAYRKTETENLLIIGCASYYFTRKDRDDWLHSLQCNAKNASYVINYWNEIKSKLKAEIMEQNKQINNINDFKL